MLRRRTLSAHARRLLSLLAGEGARWSHGYDLGRRAGIASGTLYPLLARLEAQGHLEATWLPADEPGRPPRHGYRLTASGVALARDNPPLASQSSTPAGRPA